MTAGVQFDYGQATMTKNQLLCFVVIHTLIIRSPRLKRPAHQAHPLLQLATGLGNVLLGWPLAAAVLHTGGAAALAVVLTWTLCETRRASVKVSQPAGGLRASGSGNIGAA